MCGRYTAWQLARFAWRDYDIAGVVPWGEYVPTVRYNAGPGTLRTVFTAAGPADAHWGIANPVQAGLLINATAEKLLGRFWRPMLGRRLLVPANGWFEWDRAKLPWLFTWTAQPAFCFAGVADRAGSFVVVTTPANADCTPYHHRMPALLTPDQARAWLDPQLPLEAAAAIPAPLPPGLLEARRVTRDVGNVRNDGPEVIEAATE